MVQALLEGHGAPGPSGPPVLQRIHRRATTNVVTVWRMVYDLPANDPRVLAMTEHAAAVDLLERSYYRTQGEPEGLTPEQVDDIARLLNLARTEYDGSSLQRTLLERLSAKKNPTTRSITSIRLRPSTGDT